MVRNKAPTYDEELRDVLIAISVVAKRLADKIEEHGKAEEPDNGKEERTYRSP